MPRPSTESKRRSKMQIRNEKTQKENERAERVKLKNEIRARLSETPIQWKRIYSEKLEENGMDPRSNFEHVNDLGSLRTRKRLLPPQREYKHYTHSRHPSRPEPRAVS